MRDDDDDDVGLGAMMARNVTSATTPRGRESSSNKGGKRISRSRSASVNRKSKSKKKDGDDKSVSSKKSTKSSRVRRTKKEGQSLSSSKSSSSPTKPKSDGSLKLSSPDDKDKKKKKKVRRIKRVKKPGTEGDDNEDEYTYVSVKSSASMKSTKSKSRNSKTRTSKSKETPSKVDAIREPILPNEGVIIKDEMDNLFPLPADQDMKTPKVRGKSSNTSSDNRRSVRASASTSSLTSASGSAGSFGIMTNKAAAEQAEAALNRVAAHKSMESDASTGERRERPSRRFSNSSSRSKDQYQRLHRDSGLSLTSITDSNDDDRSFASRRSQSNFTAMTALQKRLDEFKAENEKLQKQLYDAVAEVEESKKTLRKEQERSEAAAGDLSNANSEVEKIQEEKAFLIGCIRDMEDEFVAKDERVEKLQDVVESQLDTVELLEDKLNKTEEELVLMEEEIVDLIDVVEQKNKTQGRVASMRGNLTSGRGSISEIKEETRRLLTSKSGRPRSDRLRSKDIEPIEESGEESNTNVKKLEKELKTREAKLKSDLEECNNREQRLDTWEQELNEREEKVKRESQKISKASKEAKSSNSESDPQIAALTKEKESLRKKQMETQSKLKMLEFENDDLKMKLDRVSKMATENQKTIPVANTDLADAKALIEKKDKIIKDLEEKIENLNANGGTSEAEDDGRDLLIIELQNQLVKAKKEAATLSSGTYVTRLKLEIKKLRSSVKDLQQRLKAADGAWKQQLDKKDDAMRLLEKQMNKFKIELERRDKREKNFGADQRITDSALQNHIEDLEDEISHWKSTNADLEHELEALKANGHHDFYNSDEDVDDDCSIGSLRSVDSKMSMSMFPEDNLYIDSSTHSVGGLGEETPNRAMRTMSNIWSKMKGAPEPPGPVVSFPYGPGMLND